MPIQDDVIILITCALQALNQILNHSKHGVSNASCNCPRGDNGNKHIEEHVLRFQGMSSETGLDQEVVTFNISAYLSTTHGSFTESARLGLESALISHGADAVIVNVGLWWW